MMAPVGWCAGGILCGWFLTVPLSLLWVAVAVFLLLAWRGRTGSWWIPVLCLLFGWLNTALRTQVISEADLRLRVGDTPLLGEIHGTIARRPFVSRPVAEGETPRWRTVIEVQHLTTGKRTLPASGRVLVFSEGRLHQTLSTGMEVRVAGMIERPSAAKAPGIFDYREKLKREGIHHQLATIRESDWTIAPGQARSWSDRFQAWAKRRFASGLSEEDESLRLLWAMVLGWRTALTDEVAEPFMRSGTMHVFAISGLNIAMIAGALIMFFRLFQLPRHVCGLLTIALLWFYCEATGMQASAVRATIMMTIIVFGWALRRPLNLLNSICLAAFVILAWEPRQLFQASFQLSFSVIAAIALLLPRFDPLKERWIRTDPLLPDELTPWWKKKVVEGGRACFSALAVSLAAWLGSAPLIAYYFNLVTPGCLLANPLVVTCAMFGICSAVGGILTAWCPWLPDWFNSSAWFWVSCQSTISEWVAETPGSWCRIATPTGFELGVYYLVLFGGVCRWYRRRWMQITSLLAIAAIVGLRARESQCVEITVFGHNANAVLVDMPDSADDLLIDCGRLDGFRSCVAPYLDRSGMSGITSMLLSHGDIDHVEAFDEAVSRIQPGRIYISGIAQRSPVYRSAVESIPADRVATVVAGDHVGVWKVLNPTTDLKPTRADEAAIVLRADLFGTRVLLLSDLDETGQRGLLQSTNELSAEILIVGTPDSGIVPEFLKAVGPELLIIQGNSTPMEERISHRAARRYQTHSGRIVNLSDLGSVRVRINGRWKMAP